MSPWFAHLVQNTIVHFPNVTQMHSLILSETRIYYIYIYLSNVLESYRYDYGFFLPIDNVLGYTIVIITVEHVNNPKQGSWIMWDVTLTVTFTFVYIYCLESILQSIIVIAKYKLVT